MNRKRLSDHSELRSSLEKQNRELNRISQALNREVTKRKKLETKLREIEQRYAVLAAMETELVCRYLPDTTLTFVNDAYCRYFQKTREDLVGKSFLTLLPSEWHESILENTRFLCETGQTIIFEHQVINASGELGWQQWENHVLPNKDGRVRELQAIGHDITNSKCMEEILRRKQGELNRISENYQRLTPREREVMSLIVVGQLNKEIAAGTGVTERTIKFHRHQIMEKMQAGSLAELARMAEKLTDLDTIAQRNLLGSATFVA